MLAERTKLRLKGISLGYEIYINCDSGIVTNRISNKLGSNKKVIGVIGIDHGLYSEIFARQTTSFYIPTVTYIYNDKTLMDQKQFPTLISLISTKEKEGELIVRFLEEMDYGYMDIWYHQLSKEIADHISKGYLSEIGHCGRTQGMSKKLDENSHLLKDYYGPTKSSATVQLLLQNSKSASMEWLKYVTENLGFRNKIYVTGTSNGRDIYHKEYSDVLRRLNGSDDTVIYPLSALINTQLSHHNNDLAYPWEEKGHELDELYRKSQFLRDEDGCADGCQTTSWTPHVVAGTKIIVRALQDNLENNPESSNCSSVTEFRRQIFETIVNETREIEVELDANVTLKVSFKGRTISSPTKLGIYRSKTDDYHILGEVSPELLKVTNYPLFQNISHYEKRCSVDCLPGTYSFYKTVADLTILPCCWECKRCSPNQFSNQTNQHTCHKCGSNETTNEDRTGCRNVEIIYIKTSSNIFIGGLTLVIIGIVLVALTVVLVWKNEERPVIKASEPGYMYTILASIAIGFLGSIMPLLEPNQLVCSMEYVVIIISSTLITTNLLWKCIKIHGIFAAANSFQRPKFEMALKQAGHVFLNSVSLAFVTVFLFIDGFGTGPGWKFHIHQKVHHAPRYPECYLRNYYHGAISVLPLSLPLVYFLATLIFVFKMRKFPHNFRETLSILGATLIVTFCCVMFLSGYSVSPPETRALLRSVIVYITYLAFLLCLFLPKVIILVQKDVDTEEEKRIIKESLQVFASRASGMGKRLSAISVATPINSPKRSPRNSPSNSLIPSPALGGKRSHVSVSPTASPSSIRKGEASQAMAQAGGRTRPRQVAIPKNTINSPPKKAIAMQNIIVEE
ncbi:G-protein coupled receptor family C group 6 member A-like [Bolinopsis microptera]|uniref:G-protein coupled receptor family C group 6 member A-like n=1 Tax=Bolinopsis microptera TaxID=2820187 RepID=UPI00307B0E03